MDPQDGVEESVATSKPPGRQGAAPVPVPAPAHRRAHPPGRTSRCSEHSSSSAVGSCAVCGRNLCLPCAILVRGTLVGAECLPAVLGDAPAVDPGPVPVPPRGRLLALAGFGLAVAASIFPWSRFDGNGLFGAWAPHWSLLAAVAAATGLIFTLAGFVRPLDRRVEAAGYAGLAAALIVASLLHRQHPPPLTEAAPAVWLALAGGALALIGAVRHAVSQQRASAPAAPVPLG